MRSVALCACLAAHGPALSSATDIRAFLEGLDAGAPPLISDRMLHDAAGMAAFYRSRDHEPVWTGSPEGAARLTELTEEVRASAAHGLIPRHYHLEGLETAGAGILTTELLATDAFLAQARHRAVGAVSPLDLDPDWHLPPNEVEVTAVLSEAVREGSVGASLRRLWPQHDEYRRLVAKRAEVQASGTTRTTLVEAGTLLKPGQSGPRVLQLKERLLGPGDYTQEFDEPLREAVIAFQNAASLEADGMVGEATLEVLNATHFSWLARLDANLERWRWLPNRLPSSYLRINIAAFQLRAIENGEESLRMNVIVGRPYRRTPVFTETLKYLVYNPFWNVPRKLAVQDKLPLLKTDPVTLALQGYEARAAGSEAFVPVDAVDWREVTPRGFDYLLRQQPGPMNALGRIKFMLPNSFAVYLHDTPDRSLFAKQERSFSSGCIRLSDPLRLAEWILERDGQTSAAVRAAEVLAGRETAAIYLKTPLPVLIVYLTAFANDQGEVVFRRDLYQRDQVIVNALRRL